MLMVPQSWKTVMAEDAQKERDGSLKSCPFLRIISMTQKFYEIILYLWETSV